MPLLRVISAVMTNRHVSVSRYVYFFLSQYEDSIDT